MADGFPVRVAAYATVLLLVLADMMFGGPLRQRMDRQRPGSPESMARARAQGIVARVLKYPITREQLERAVAQRLWLEGRQPGQLAASERKILTYAVLSELIDHQLLRVKTQANADEAPVSGAEIDAAVHAFRSHFPADVDFPAALATQGIASEKELRFRLAATLQQEKYLETRIQPAILVSQDEVRAWYDANPTAAEIPPAVRIRQVFISSRNRSPSEARAIADRAQAELAQPNGDFAALAARVSEDDATKGRGGDLGWLAPESLPRELAAAIAPLKVGGQALVRSPLGSHLIELTERRDASRRTFDDMQAEIRPALEAQKRAYAVAEYRRRLRHLERLHVLVDKEGLFPAPR